MTQNQAQKLVQKWTGRSPLKMFKSGEGWRAIMPSGREYLVSEKDKTVKLWRKDNA